MTLTNKEASFCCKAAASSWSTKGETRDACYLSGRCVFVGNLIRKFTLYLRVIIYLKKLRTSEWLKTSPFFMQCKCKVVTRMQFCCLWKIYLCLLTPNCTVNHVVTYTKNIHEKFTRFWLAETKCICHVTRVQSWNMNTNYI